MMTAYIRGSERASVTVLGAGNSAARKGPRVGTAVFCDELRECAA
jgi:hypothetical protein